MEEIFFYLVAIFLYAKSVSCHVNNVLLKFYFSILYKNYSVSLLLLPFQIVRFYYIFLLLKLEYAEVDFFFFKCPK